MAVCSKEADLDQLKEHALCWAVPKEQFWVVAIPQHLPRIWSITEEPWEQSMELMVVMKHQEVEADVITHKAPVTFTAAPFATVVRQETLYLEICNSNSVLAVH